MADTQPVASTETVLTQSTPAALSDFEKSLKEEFRPKTSERETAIQSAVRTLAEQALRDTKLISKDAISTVESIIAAIDRQLSDQINLVIHHPDFKNLEGAWRGLHHLVNKTETDEQLKIRILNISKKELGRSLRNATGALMDQSPIFKKVYTEEYDTPGGEPYGVLIGDYHFDHSGPDVEILNGMAQIAAAAHSPFITGASPTLMDMETWQELSNPRDLTKVFDTPEYAPWRSLRASENARYLGLTMPRFLARLPYDPKNNPVEEFAFEEDVASADHSKYIWANSAYAMGTNITRAFKLHGWCSCIRGVENGGMVDSLPCHTFPTDDGGVDMKCPTEIAIAERRSVELDKAGLLPLLHWKNTDYAVFIGAQSLQKPIVYDKPEATSNANLAARLPYLFAVCRFAHYLKCIVRDKIGSFKERKDMEEWLNEWIMNYVTGDSRATDEVKAEYPLAAAKVTVESVLGNPGYYTSNFYLRPHFQLEGLTASLRLVTTVPSVKGEG